MESSDEAKVLEGIAAMLNTVPGTEASVAPSLPPWSIPTLRAQGEGTVLVASFERGVLSVRFQHEGRPPGVGSQYGLREAGASRLAERYGLDLGIMWGSQTKWHSALLGTWRRCRDQTRLGGDPVAVAIQQEQAEIDAYPKYQGDWDEAAFRESMRPWREGRPGSPSVGWGRVGERP